MDTCANLDASDIRYIIYKNDESRYIYYTHLAWNWSQR